MEEPDEDVVVDGWGPVAEEPSYVGIVRHHQSPGWVDADLEVVVVAAGDVESGSQLHGCSLPSGDRGSGFIHRCSTPTAAPARSCGPGSVPPF